MPDPHWRYFLALEARFSDTLRYVELCPENFHTYSIEFASILLAAASEVDVVAKLFCKTIDSGSTAHNINEYCNCILGRFPRFHETNLSIQVYGIPLQPWASWNYGTNPTWWRAYNNVKHERDTYFSEATLENAMNAVAGLLCVLLYHLAPRAQELAIYPFPELIKYDGIRTAAPLIGPPAIVLPDSR